MHDDGCLVFAYYKDGSADPDIFVLRPCFEGGQVLKSANNWPRCASASLVTSSFILECFLFFYILCWWTRGFVRRILVVNCCFLTLTSSLIMFCLTRQFQFLVHEDVSSGCNVICKPLPYLLRLMARVVLTF
ncbi:hypothetical protein OIU78_004042 [Salix suchowensis]|nr:hypothetical protein OIU78_004042 [Salix suchowensis]